MDRDISVARLQTSISIIDELIPVEHSVDLVKQLFGKDKLVSAFLKIYCTEAPL